ncbi:MAG: hypothetical protein R3185_04260 [Candidatus Thermoplasmatota archaeon]|nr:hypothetical protein [Candidatus Thermoplasmatota archaeon]
MRSLALLLALAMVTAGCIGGSDDADEAAEPTNVEDGDQGNRSAQATTANNSSANATYLKNEDYSEAHIHDYWNGAEERVLMDEVLATNTFQSTFVTLFWPFIGEGTRTSVGTVWFTLPNNTFVPEGTGELVVEVDATSALESGQLVLAHKAANTNEYVELDAQGAQASWTIPLEPEMADLPHAKSTRWGWRLDAQGNGAILDGEFSVTITAKKLYDLTAWPAHEDPWQGGAIDRLSLANLDGTFDVTDPTPWFNPLADEAPDVTLPPGTIVPPETRLLLVKFWYAMDGNAKNNANADVTLRVKEGSTSGFYRGMWSEEIQDEPGFKMFAIPASSENWDSPYADESGWAFQITAPTGLRDPQTGESWLYMGVAEAGSGNYTLEVTAFKNVPGWLQEEVQGDA